MFMSMLRNKLKVKLTERLMIAGDDRCVGKRRKLNVEETSQSKQKN